MPTRLREQTMTSIDEQNCELCGRSPRRHVACVLLVTRCVCDNELALIGREEPVRHIDGDALLALGREAIHQQSEVDIAPLGPHLL